ncbi:MAG: DNRLRE domain-containing protein [Byssovorax sp.]
MHMADDSAGGRSGAGSTGHAASWRTARLSTLSALVVALAGCGEAPAPGEGPAGDGPPPATDGPLAAAVEAGSTPLTCVTFRREGHQKAWDTFVSEEKKNNSYGSSSFAGITGKVGGATRALFRFDLSAIPHGATVTSAGLGLTQNNTGPGTAKIHLVGAAWDEATVTWNSLGSTFGPSFGSVSNASANMVFPVGPQVQAWVNGTAQNNGFLIEQSEPSLTRFYSHEWALAGQRPFLSVCYKVTCDAGHADCNGNAADGCETDLSSPQSCGACGNVCSFPHASATCAGGSCAPGACDAGRGDCDGNAQNGCETDLATTGNCGACGNVCSFPNASAICAGGTCKLGACDAGSYDCDGNAQNGCEPTPCTDGSHCGGAGDCASQVCLGGSCAAPSCNDHVKNGVETGPDCGGPCGACADGLGCAAASDCQSQVCNNGVCQVPTCSDGVKNQGELFTDLGGPCASSWRSALYPADWTPAFTTADGLFLHDFSYAGYHRSEAALPSSWPGIVVDVNTKGAHPNTAQDSRAAFVSAITAVKNAGGGVVYVPDGEYIISSPITINASNLLIRGQSRANTKLFFSKITTAQAGFIFQGTEPTTAGRVALASDAVPRSKDVYVQSAASFSVGQDVLIDIVITQAWINEHGMQGLWDNAGNNALNLRRDFFRRTITAIDASVSPNKITLDVPIRYPMKTRDDASIRPDVGALKEIGIEHLSVNTVTTAAAAAANPRGHAFWFQRVTDGFIRDVGSYASARAPVAGYHLQSGGVYLVENKRITVQNCTMEHAQNHGDGGAGYAFEASMSNEVLFKDDIADDVRHAFIQNWDFGASGLVFLRCTADNDIAVNPTFSTPGTSEFHHRLAIANLYDSCHDSSGFMALNRTTDSSYSGHTSTQNVFWNTSGGGTPDSILRSYQFGMGYIIGTVNITPRVVADAIDSFFLADQGTSPTDYLEGADIGPMLEPQSLFEDQLTRRLASP